MLRADAVITSADPLTGDPVLVTSAAVRATWHPLGAVLFAGCADGGGPAEQNCCGYLNFFASAANAWKWASQHPGVTGRVLDQARAQALGAQTFRSLLSDGH